MSVIFSEVDEVDPADEHAVLRFERRRVDRWRLDGHATAFVLSGDHFGHMQELQMIDYSSDGLGAVCDGPMPPGAEVSIGFSAPGHAAKRGRVIRCLPCGEGYRVAVQFQLRLAA